MKIDRTELFNVLTVIAMMILADGDSLFELFELDFVSVPEWSVPILLLVVVVVNWFSRSQVKGEAGMMAQDILDRSLADDIDRLGVDFGRVADAIGANPEDLKSVVRKVLDDTPKFEALAQADFKNKNFDALADVLGVDPEKIKDEARKILSDDAKS